MDKTSDKDLQVFIKTGKTTLQKSDSIFDIKPYDQTKKNAVIALDEMPLLEKYTKVDFQAKVISIKSPDSWTLYQENYLKSGHCR